MLNRAMRMMMGTCCILACQIGLAGGGPETTLLVVNAASPLSLAVANEYARLRDLPAHHMLWLEGIPPTDTIDVDTFRARVLAPIRAHLAATGLEDEIDLIAYSAGFPYAVDFRRDEQARGLASDRHRGDAGSLTGMTFFARQVEAGQVGYLVRQANQYFRRPLRQMMREAAPVPMEGGEAVEAEQATDFVFEGARGFRSRYYWGRGLGWSGMDEGDRYFLSAMLAHTGIRGNSLPEVSAYLGRAATSDGTRPAGTVYLMDNPDIRSRVRRHLFSGTVEALGSRGRAAEVLVAAGQDGQNGREPRGRSDIIGLVAGTAVFDLDSAGSRLLPGAIAESFTSYGGHFAYGAQTKLTAFLRHGAAGSSGAVREPYSFVEKFPVPQMHVHYADGVSLAEAFFQSVWSPYQLLVVGDPLARPFARFAEVSLPYSSDDSVWRGRVEFAPQVMAADGRAIERLELWLDGRRLEEVAPGAAFVVDTLKLDDGAHEMRVVAVEASDIETRSYARRSIRVDNHGRQVGFDDPPAAVSYGGQLVLGGNAAGARRVKIRQGLRVLADVEVRHGRWLAELASATLGLGQVMLEAIAEYPDGGRARARPHLVSVVEPQLLLSEEFLPASETGLAIVVERPGEAAAHAVLPGLQGRLPGELLAGGAERVTISGMFEVRASGLYELTLEGAGKMSLEVGADWRHDEDVPRAEGGVRFAVPLVAGWHRFKLEITRPESDAVRAVLAGPEVAFELAGDRVRHSPL